jgi:hypothetical protein
MRTPACLSYFAAFVASTLLACSALFAQTNPPPADPHEMVTRDPRTLTKPADRSGALDFMNRARDNFNLHSLPTPYAIKVSFESNGATQMEGTWTMDEISDGQGHWRWSAQLGDYQVVRIGTEGKTYGTDPSNPIPLRVQLARSALFRPVMHDMANYVIRSANVESKGKSLSCFLMSNSLPPNPAPRSWVERELCLDSGTGLLQMWSEAPGIYALYDYAGAADFHGHLFPHDISIFEDGRPAVQIRVEKLEDAPNLDPSLLRPTAEMTAAGETFNLERPRRFPMRVDPSDGPTSSFFQPVIVHAILDAEDATVLDAEPLQTSDHDLARAALEAVRNAGFEATGFQQEAFINVQFHMPAMRAGGAPMFHSSVRWIVLDHPIRPPGRRPAR